MGAALRELRSLYIAVALFALALVPTGCAQEAVMIRESQSGGVLTYPFRNESDVLASSGRQSALRLIDQKCPQGSRIVHEGEVPKIRKDVDRIWEGQMSGSRLWGVEFTCK